MQPFPQSDTVPSVRERLLDSAEKVVGRDGVANLTLEAIARDAGVSKGGLLYHFPSKSALIIAVVQRLARRFDSEQDRAVAGDPHVAGASTRAYLTTRAEPPDPQEEPIHTALLAAAGTDPHYLDPFRERFAAWQARLEADGIDPATATIVRLATDGLCLCTLLNLAVPREELRRKVIDKLLLMTVPAEPGVTES